MHEPKTKVIDCCAIKQLVPNLFCAGLPLKGSRMLSPTNPAVPLSCLVSMNISSVPRSLNGSWSLVSSCCFPGGDPPAPPPLQLAPGGGRAASQPGTWARRGPHRVPAVPTPPPRPYLGELGDFLAHFQVQVLAIVHAVPRLLRGGRRGREFGRRAAVIVLLPAHARGRHLPDRPRPGHQSSRSRGGPRSNGVWEARAGTAASGPDPRCLSGAAAGALRSTTLRKPPSRDGAALPDRGRRRHPRGADARGPAARSRARPALSRCSADARRRRSGQRRPAGSTPPRHQGPSETAAAGAAKGGGDGAGWCGGEAGTWKRTREPRSCRYQDARPAMRAGTPTSFLRSQAPPRAAAAGPAFSRRGQALRDGLRGPCRQVPPNPAVGIPSPHLGAEPRGPRLWIYAKKFRERGWGYLWSFRFAERVRIYWGFPRATSRALGPSGSSPKKGVRLAPSALPRLASAPRTWVMKWPRIQQSLPWPIQTHINMMVTMFQVDHCPKFKASICVWTQLV